MNVAKKFATIQPNHLSHRNCTSKIRRVETAIINAKADGTENFLNGKILIAGHMAATDPANITTVKQERENKRTATMNIATAVEAARFLVEGVRTAKDAGIPRINMTTKKK